MSIGLDSRVVIGGYEISNGTASLVATARFRPQNIGLQAVVAAGAVLAITGGPPAWEAIKQFIVQVFKSPGVLQQW
jgi:hypothetical protein